MSPVRGPHQGSPPGPGHGPPEADTAPTWTAAAVARRLGVAPATLRSWGHRYGIGPAQHRAGRYRRYTEADVAELDTLRRLTVQGMPLAAAAEVARAQHRGATWGPDAGPGPPHPRSGGPEPVADPDADLETLRRAAQRLDTDEMVRILEAGLARRGVRAAWETLCRPALTTPPIDDATECIDAEAVLAWAVTTSLRRLPSPPPAPPDSRRVLLACAPGEQHTLAMDALLAALDEAHVPARMLGPSVPTTALCHAAETTHPAAVVVWAQSERTAHPASLRPLRPHTGTVVAAGPGWASRVLPDSVGAVDSLDDAVRLARACVDRAFGECPAATAPAAERRG